MLAVCFGRTYPDRTAVLALENPIGLEDYRSAIPPQPLATLVATEMAQTPEGYRTFMKAFFATWTPEREALGGAGRGVCPYRSGERKTLRSLCR